MMWFMYVYTFTTDLSQFGYSSLCMHRNFFPGKCVLNEHAHILFCGVRAKFSAKFLWSKHPPGPHGAPRDPTHPKQHWLNITQGGDQKKFQRSARSGENHDDL